MIFFRGTQFNGGNKPQDVVERHYNVPHAL